jgi:uncharacterized membrane protein YkoI
MLRTKIVPIAMAAVIAVGSTVGVAHAANDKRGGEGAQERATIVSAKISLAQAIAAAEQQAGGKAIDAGLENENGTMAFAIEVAKDNVVQKVLVDLQTGKVLKVVAADDEEDGERDND